MKELDLTKAAEKYLEQYGEPLVMNTYLKVTVLALCAISVALAALVYRSQNALAAMHPMIVRINDVGRAEAIDYRNFQYRPQKAENKYYLSRWAELYFSRKPILDRAGPDECALFSEWRRSARGNRPGAEGQFHPELCARLGPSVCRCRSQKCRSR